MRKRIRAYRLWAIWALLACGLALPGQGRAQPAKPGEAGGTGVQILTTDLQAVTIVQKDRLEAHFVIMSDTGTIQSVTINGEAQNFAPADTVEIVKGFQFTAASNVVTVQAKDSTGVSLEKTYVVRVATLAPEKKLAVNAVVGLSYEYDDNPTDDLSLPPGVSISGVTINGVVKTSEKLDTRTILTATGLARYGDADFSVGGYDQTYTKSINKGLNVQMLYAGAGYRFAMGQSSDFLVHYTFTNLNVGETAYANLNTATGGFEFRSQDNDYTRRHLLELGYTQKTFASSSQTNGGQELLKWDYYRTDAAKLDNFNAVFQLGNATEGDKLTDYNYLSGDWDWRNRWEAGFRWDLGFGYQYRSYPNDNQPLTNALGTTRLDNLIRLSTGLGWQFNPAWSAMATYYYLTDISNKSPYVRGIYGVTVSGGF